MPDPTLAPAGVGRRAAAGIPAGALPLPRTPTGVRHSVRPTPGASGAGPSANEVERVRVPHPFPYQGSKRAIAERILAHLPGDAGRLVEPFCGSAAVSLAAAAHGCAGKFWLNDRNAPLMALWKEILARPAELAQRYEDLWRAQRSDRKAFFFDIRDRFNRTHEPSLLLYLLARIVKGSVRYSSGGQFNQSPDNRRSGMRPDRMRRQLLGVSTLMAGRTRTTARDFRVVVAEASEEDVLYLDPPYQGTSFTRDHRYYDGLSYGDLVSALESLNRNDRSYLVSYDGRTGERRHGKPLPAHLGLRHLSVVAGRSTQSTLLGENRQTVESLYLSPSLLGRLDASVSRLREEPHPTQGKLAFAS